jgi:excisionase family DNA binding protein
MDTQPQTEVPATEPRKRPSLQPPLPRKTVTVYEASHMTGLGLTTITTLIGTGALRSTKIGRRRLIFVDSIDALLTPTE